MLEVFVLAWSWVLELWGGLELGVEALKCAQLLRVFWVLELFLAWSFEMRPKLLRVLGLGLATNTQDPQQPQHNEQYR